MALKTRMRLGAVAAVVAVLVTGCSGSPDDQGAAAPSPSSAGQASGGQASGGAASAPATPSLAPAPAPSPLGAAKQVTDGFGGEYTMAPVTLNRRGSLLLFELAVTVTKADSESANLSLLFVHGQLNLPVTLIDPVHGKRYLPAKDSQGDCLCTNFTGGVTVHVGQTGIVSAYFANPPADVTSLDVEVPKLGTFTAVPISG